MATIMQACLILIYCFYFIENGIFGEFDGTHRDMNSVQNALRNTKLREGLVVEIVGDQDKRVGLEECGTSRWGGKDDEISTMIKRKDKIIKIAKSRTYKKYAVGILDTLNNTYFWKRLSFVGAIVHLCRKSIDFIHGIETLGASYYAWNLIFIYYDDQIETYKTKLGDDYESEDFELNGYNEAELSIGDVDSKEIEEESEIDFVEKIKTFMRLKINAQHYYKLSNQDADDCFLVAFMFDARFVNEKVIQGSSDKTKFKARIRILYERDHPEKKEQDLNRDFGQLLTLTRHFRSKKGLFRDQWKYHPDINVYSTYEVSLEFLAAIKDDNEDNRLVVWWCSIGEIYCSMPASVGRLESSFNPLKLFHTPGRGALGPNNLRRLVYCYNQSRNLKRFDAKWKPNDKRKKEHD